MHRIDHVSVSSIVMYPGMHSGSCDSYSEASINNRGRFRLIGTNYTRGPLRSRLLFKAKYKRFMAAILTGSHAAAEFPADPKSKDPSHRDKLWTMIVGRLLEGAQGHLHPLVKMKKILNHFAAYTSIIWR